MAGHMRRPATAESVDALLEKSLSRFLTRQELRLGMLTSNLRMGSSHFRYALRVSIAALLGMSATALLALFLSDKDMTPTLMAHSYRSEEHTSELQSLMRISYAVFCLKKKSTTNRANNIQYQSSKQ